MISVSEQEVPTMMNSSHEVEDPMSCSDTLCYPPDDARKSHHFEKEKASLTARLNRIEGQIRGVKGMIEKDAYCDDVLNQIAAVQAALNGVGKLLLAAHMKSCVIERIEAGESNVIDELLITVNKLMK